MLSFITWHAFLCLSHSLSIAVDATPHAIVAVTVPATTMLTISHLYPISCIPHVNPFCLTEAYKLPQSVATSRCGETI